MVELMGSVGGFYIAVQINSRKELPQSKDRMAMAGCSSRMRKCVSLFIYAS